MVQIFRRFFGSECRHESTIVISSVGVRRTVCEACGHISFVMAPPSAERVATPVPRSSLRRVG